MRASSSTTPPPAASSSPRSSPAPSRGFTIAEIEPRLFSFNAPQGACPACDGLGEKLVFDEDLVVPNHDLSIAKGAVVPWAKSNPPSPYYMQVLPASPAPTISTSHVPWKDLPEEAQRVILHGTGGRPVTLRFIDGKRSYEVKKPFEGVIGNLNRRMQTDRDPRGCARSCRATRAAARAKSATAPASSPRRSR